MSDYEIMRNEIRRLHSVYRELRRESQSELAQKDLKISDLESQILDLKARSQMGLVMKIKSRFIRGSSLKKKTLITLCREVGEEGEEVVVAFLGRETNGGVFTSTGIDRSSYQYTHGGELFVAAVDACYEELN